MQYEILDHPSDVRIRACGKTKQELFKNAMCGMAAVLRPQIRSTKHEIRNIKIKSVDLNALLVDFLNEVLYLIQTNKEIYNDIKFSKFVDPSNPSGQAELEAELIGNKVVSFGEDIKAVTYHGLKIEGENGLYEATVLFDI